jgi:hypothetical protein
VATRTDRFPEFTRADAGTVLVSSRWVAQAEQQLAVADATIKAWRDSGRPADEREDLPPPRRARAVIFASLGSQPATRDSAR